MHVEYSRTTGCFWSRVRSSDTREDAGLEKSHSADQKSERRKEAILKRIHALRPVLSRQGEVVAGWRVYRGKKLGPYYRLTYRQEGRAHCVYLGRWSGLVQKVRRLLDQWQEPLRRQREWTRMRQSVKTSLGANKLRLATELAQAGLRLQGYEVRGWRKLRLRLSTSTSVASILRGGART